MASLTYRETASFAESYSDRGTGARQDLSVWQPRLLDGEYRVMYFATNKRDANGLTAVVVKEKESSNGKALAKPIHFEVVWTDKSTGGNTDGQIYKAVAPPDYVALSDVAIHGSNGGKKPGDTFPPDVIDSYFRCVHKSLVVSMELGSLGWIDAASGGKYDVALWDISESAGFKAGRGENDRPPNQQWRLDYIPGRDLEALPRTIPADVKITKVPPSSPELSIAQVEPATWGNVTQFKTTRHRLYKCVMQASIKNIIKGIMAGTRIAAGELTYLTGLLNDDIHAKIDSQNCQSEEGERSVITDKNKSVYLLLFYKKKNVQSSFGIEQICSCMLTNFSLEITYAIFHPTNQTARNVCESFNQLFIEDALQRFRDLFF